MKKIKPLLKIFPLILLIIFSAIEINAQNSINIDSLKNVVEKMPNDSIKVAVFYKIAVGSYRTNPEQTYKFAKKSLKLAKELDIKTEIAKSFHILGIFYAERGDLRRALEYFF